MTRTNPSRPTANARPIPGTNSPKVTQSDATAKVMSLPRVTRVTRNSTDSLRARARRASNESHVTQVISMLTSDTSDTKLQLSAPLRAHTPTIRLIKTDVTSVTRFDRPSQ